MSEFMGRNTTKTLSERVDDASVMMDTVAWSVREHSGRRARSDTHCECSNAEYAARILLFPERGRLDHESVSKRLSENATMWWPPRSKLDIAQSSCRQQSTDKRSITFQSAPRAQRNPPLHALELARQIH